ncbi:MAG: hypothetical protein Q7S66_05055 [bacterium]|nr:hypothetical protein [bacterium]
MIERFTESKPIESKEAAVKRAAREMLERFRARFKRGGKVEHIEEPIPSPEPVTTEEEKIIAKKEEQEVAAEPQLPEESETIEPSVSEKVEAKPTKKEREKKTDKGTFESTVTNNYFESWDEELELEGNAGIKDKIRENIIQAEKRNQRVYEDAAADLRISVEEFKAKLQAKVEEMVGRAEFFRATPLDVLEKIMNVDGRWKNQFETATSNGTLDPNFRAIKEIKMFGFNKTESPVALTDLSQYDSELTLKLPKKVLEKDKEKRPIYGYFSDDEHGGINNRNGKIPPPTFVDMYGRVNFKIKKERALKKATITFHDSLGPGSDWPPTPAAKPHFTSFRLSHYGGSVLETLKGPSIVNWGESYTEVQYHGQLTMDDVESIHISTHNGLYPQDIEKVRKIFNEYKRLHPGSAIQLIEF